MSQVWWILRMSDGFDFYLLWNSWNTVEVLANNLFSFTDLVQSKQKFDSKFSSKLFLDYYECEVSISPIHGKYKKNTDSSQTQSL